MIPVNEGRFRADLYARVAAVVLHVEPLRRIQQRLVEIAVLALAYEGVGMYCTPVLIESHWALTARHCAEGRLVPVDEESDATGTIPASARSGLAGAFAVGNLLPGQCQVEVRAPDGGSLSAVVSSGEPTELVLPDVAPL